MDSIKHFLESVTVPLLLSLFGGAARALHSGFKSWRQFMASLFVSGFAGVVVHLLMQHAELSSSVKAALVGLSGYSGGAILDALAGRLQKSVEKLAGPEQSAPGQASSEQSVWDGVNRRKTPKQED